jgi:hypothetical protein
MVLYSNKTFSPLFGPSSGAERLNAKNIWDEEHDTAILEEIGIGKKVLIMMRKHHLVMHLGMDHHHQKNKRMAAIKSVIMSSHRN